jgi:hypothetical protein
LQAPRDQTPDDRGLVYDKVRRNRQAEFLVGQGRANRQRPSSSGYISPVTSAPRSLFGARFGVALCSDVYACAGV